MSTRVEPEVEGIGLPRGGLSGTTKTVKMCHLYTAVVPVRVRQPTIPAL